MFIARQPIFDRSLKIFGYELLYRSSQYMNLYDAVSPENATATVLGGLFEFGLPQVVRNTRAFINFDYNFLLSDSIELIDPATLVIELLEHTKVDDILLQRLNVLKKNGYRIALDDFDDDIGTSRVVPFADIIKFDIIATPLDEIRQAVKAALRKNKIILAEKIEHESDFIKAKSMGFHLFQGYFFSKPKIIVGMRTRKSANYIYQRIINELHQAEPSYRKIAEIIETDVNMAYRVLKLAGQRKKEDKKTTIRRALSNMGLRELERWINVLMIQELSSDKPAELMRLSLIRSKLGESFAYHSMFHHRRHEISLMCLFSVLDAMLDQTMQEALDGVLVSDEIREALVNHDGPLKSIYDIVRCYENGDWNRIETIAKEIHLDPERMFFLYIEAIKWANEVLEYII